LKSERLTIIPDFFIRIAESVPVLVALVMCRIGEVLQGKARFDVVFAVMQYCRVGNGAYRTLLHELQLWHQVGR